MTTKICTSSECFILMDVKFEKIFCMNEQFRSAKSCYSVAPSSFKFLMLFNLVSISSTEAPIFETTSVCDLIQFSIFNCQNSDVTSSAATFRSLISSEHFLNNLCCNLIYSFALFLETVFPFSLASKSNLWILSNSFPKILQGYTKGFILFLFIKIDILSNSAEKSKENISKKPKSIN